MASREKLYTLRDLMEMPEDENDAHYELSEGELIEVPPPNLGHGRLIGKLLRFLLLFIEAGDLGLVSNNTGFLLHHDPKSGRDTVRMPDIYFIRAERLLNVPNDDVFHGPPDLAIEVISPSETSGRVNSKLRDYFAYGVQLVWLIYPEKRQITVYTSSNQYSLLEERDTLIGGDVLPGFSIPVRELFAVLDSPPVQPNDQASS